MLHLATSIARPNLVAMGTCFGKFSKSGKFKLGVTCLDWIATYAKYKVSWRCILGEKASKPKEGSARAGKERGISAWRDGSADTCRCILSWGPEKTAIAINSLGVSRVGTRDDLSRLGWNGGIRA